MTLVHTARNIAFCACVACATSVGSAGQPLIDKTFTDAGRAPVADCGDFQVLDQYTISSTVILFFDEAGNLSRFIEQNDGTDQFINAKTGKTLRALPFHNTVLVDRVAHEGTTTGIILRVVVPGAGAVLLDVGRIVTRRGEITFQAGPHQFFDGDLGALCAALQ